MLSGKKTFLASALSIVVGVGGALSGSMDGGTAGQYILGGMMGIFMRLGITKAEKEK